MNFFKSTLAVVMSLVLFAGSFAAASDSLPDFDEYPNILQIKKHEKCDCFVVTLRNGMTVYIKTTDFDEDEVYIQFIALGGYNSLSKELRGTGRLAAKMVWYAGVGEYKGDKLPCFMYDNSIEMTPSIEAFSRQIQTTVPKENIEKALQLIQLTFTDPQYSEKGAQAVIEKQEEEIRKGYYDYDFIFKDMSSTLNSGSSIYLKPMTIRGMKKVKPDEALTIFKQGFSNPAEFKAVIIGNMEAEKIVALVDKYLGSLPPQKPGTWPENKPIIDFPVGKREEVVPGKVRPETTTRLTFPVQVVLQEENFALAQLIAQVVEIRLREVVRKEVGQAYFIDTALELPLYPYHDEVWLTVHYSVPKSVSPKIQQVILKELQRLQQEGVTSEQLAKVKASQKRTDQFWLKDNHHWLSMLLNYSVWGWNPDEIVYDYDNGVNLDEASVQKSLKTFISLDNYTSVTSVD